MAYCYIGDKNRLSTHSVDHGGKTPYLIIIQKQLYTLCTVFFLFRLLTFLNYSELQKLLACQIIYFGIQLSKYPSK